MSDELQRCKTNRNTACTLQICSISITFLSNNVTLVLCVSDFFSVVRANGKWSTTLPFSQAHIHTFWLREITNLANNRKFTCGQPSWGKYMFIWPYTVTFVFPFCVLLKMCHITALSWKCVLSVYMLVLCRVGFFCEWFELCSYTFRLGSMLLVFLQA